LRAFFLAQRRGLRLDPELLQMIRNHRELVTQSFRQDAQVQEAFLELFKHPGHVGGTLRALHETGLLGALIPPFARLTGQVQHEFFHQYTVDEHTLVCLEKLDDIVHQKTPALAPYTAIFRRLERPEVLYLALLLHDAGKGEGRNHAESGARIAATVTRRLRLEAAAAARVEFLVRHHLDMVTLSQKRDLDDPHVVQQFADLVREPENLHALTLLTLADSLGTSDKLWNAFKDQLLLMLHHRAEQHLQGNPQQAEVAARERLREEVHRTCPAGIGPDEIEAHFAALPPGYFHHATAEEVVDDLQAAHDFLSAEVGGDDHPLAPVIRSRSLPALSCSVVRCCAWDHHGLFARLTGAFTAADLNILSAEIYTRRDDFALDRFHVCDAATGSPASSRALERFALFARGALTGSLDLAEALRGRRSPRTPGFVVPGGGRLPTRIEFDNHSSPSRTILEIEAEDRLGLLYTIASVLAELGVDISLAKINTANGAASDVFYVSEAGGTKIEAAARQKQIRLTLQAAITRLR
jgi:[protein-PII] uridylyltransferase